MKLSFSDNTRGEVISLANKNNYTTLSLAYKLLELNTEAQTIRFVENPEEQFLIQDLYVPAPHASNYGWNQQVSLEEALVEQIQKYYEATNKTWDIDKSPQRRNQKKLLRWERLNWENSPLLSFLQLKKSLPKGEIKRSEQRR